MSSTDQVLRDKLAHLETCERSDLVKVWIKAYGAPPFKGARRGTLIRRLAYHVQSKQMGGLKPSVSRKLIKIAAAGIGTSDCLDKSSKSNRAPKTQLGAQFVRKWNGKTHTMQVTDTGYVMGGITYGSLSAAAKASTRAHWSGPRFFSMAGQS